MRTAIALACAVLVHHFGGIGGPIMLLAGAATGIAITQDIKEILK